MSRRGWSSLVLLVAVGVAACYNNNQRYPVGPGQSLGNPDSLSYLLLPGGPDQPNGVLLSWVPSKDPNVTNYIVYARAADTGQYGTVGTTVSNTFHDAGRPARQYYVASQDQVGNISSGTSPVTIDTTPPLSPPDQVTGVGIDSGAKLRWSASARLQNPSLFSYYRVYSETATGSGSTLSCPNVGSDFALEGSSVSEAFVVTGLANGTTWCYGVTAVSLDGHESFLSQWAQVTPSASGGRFDVVAVPGVTMVVHKHG